MTTTKIGRWGDLLDIRGPAPEEIEVESARPVTLTTALSGRVYPSLRGAARRRAWKWGLNWTTDAEMADLEQLEDDAKRGVLFWYDEGAVGTNMILADYAEPVANDLGLVAAGTATNDGRTWDFVTGAVSIDVPTIDGTGYTAEVRVNASTDITIEELDADRSVVTTITSGTQAGLVLSVSWTAGTEPGVRITVDGTWSGLQMFETASDPGGWRPGRGIPAVVIPDLSAVLSHVVAGDAYWASAAVTLREVEQ